MRTFLAIELPETVKDELVRIQNEINVEGKIKFVERANLHLTLKFIGDIQDELLDKVKSALDVVECSRISTSLSEIGKFPPKGDPRVIWVGLDPSDEVCKLQSQIEERLGALFEKDKRSYSAHITIGRVKLLKVRNELEEQLEGIKVAPINFEIDKFLLKKSTLTQKGSIYEDLANFSLT